MSLEAMREAVAAARRAPGRARHHQPARDRGALGPADTRAGGSGDRLAGPAHHGALPRAARERRRAAAPRAHRPGRRSLLLRHQAGMAAARPRAPPPRRAGRARGRHGGELAGGPPQRRARSRDRSHQRLAHAALRSSPRGTGTRSCSRCSTCRRNVCRASWARPGWWPRSSRLTWGTRCPIAGLAGDQQAALFGQGCCSDGLAKNTYGTGAFLLVYPGAGATDAARRGARHGRLRAAGRAGVRARGERVHRRRRGAVAARRSRPDPRGRRKPRRSRGACPDTGGVQFVPAFVGLGTPYWEPEARGTITGLTRGTTRAHLVRAALEAIAYSSAELLRGDGRRPRDSRCRRSGRTAAPRPTTG